MATLFVLQGRDQGKRYDLRGVTSLGREAGNRIQVNDSEASRRHAEIRQDAEGFVLVDLASSNGTFVNAEKATERRLVSGDRIQIGRTLLLFTAAADRSSVLAHDVAIIGQPAAAAGSRILKSVSPESGSQLFSTAADSPWLAAARSNVQLMYRTALAVSHTLDIDQLLGRILDLIFEWVEADRGCVMLVDHETGELTPAASRNRKGVEAGGRMAISRTILDYVQQQQQGVLTSNAQDDARWNAADGSIAMLGVREAICVPMQGRYGIVGVIYIDTYTPPGKLLPARVGHKFSEEHLKLMVAIGYQAALAVEDTSFYSAMLQAERLAAMGQTIATLSHHIKNILQGIRGGSYLIEEGLKGEDFAVVRRGWRIVERNQERISNLVMDMLTFSKDREPALVSADLNETVGDVVELMKLRANEAGVTLVWQPRADLPRFSFDPDLLHRAILNVVTNAIDACEQRAAAQVAVSIEWSPGERLVHVVVADNGEGIAEEDRERIFSLFESKKGSRGTGLGLPVSQKIVREHGGEIRVESTPGLGSRFYLELPTHLPEEVRNTDTLSSLPRE
jgi:two-component system, NtrC family, sensor kinase